MCPTAALDTLPLTILILKNPLRHCYCLPAGQLTSCRASYRAP
jgi:hypothetical protein